MKIFTPDVQLGSIQFKYQDLVHFTAGGAVHDVKYVIVAHYIANCFIFLCLMLLCSRSVRL